MRKAILSKGYCKGVRDSGMEVMYNGFCQGVKDL
jgi:hypothetical protein